MFTSWELVVGPPAGTALEGRGLGVGGEQLPGEGLSAVGLALALGTRCCVVPNGRADLRSVFMWLTRCSAACLGAGHRLAQLAEP